MEISDMIGSWHRLTVVKGGCKPAGAVPKSRTPTRANLKPVIRPYLGLTSKSPLVPHYFIVRTDKLPHFRDISPCDCAIAVDVNDDLCPKWARKSSIAQ